MFADILPGKEILSYWLLHYGSFAIFAMMALGIIALPVPEETLMVIAGIFMSKGQLNIPLTLLACYLGSMTGITMSYFVGRTAGIFFVKKYGGWVGLNEKKLAYAHSWFQKYGKWSLFFGYFIPGIRHLTGLTAGMTYLQYRQFALYAYFGAILWVTTFLGVGYFLHSYWRRIFLIIEASVEQIILVLIFVLICWFFVHKLKRKH